MSPVALRTSVLLVLSAILMFGAGCAPGAETPGGPAPTISRATSTSSTTTTLRRTTTSEAGPVLSFTKVDPVTLMPVPGLEPLLTGDTHGLISPNGRWLVLENWGEGRWLIDTATWEIVSDFRPWGHLLAVSDDGTVYAARWDPVWAIRRFPPGGEDWVEVATLESSWSFSGSEPVFIDDRLLAGLGHTENWRDGELTVNVIDLESGTGMQIPVPGAWVPDEPTGVFLDEGYEIQTYHQPAVAFTSNKALVVHAHEDVITEVDLDTGELTSHSFAPKTSLLDSLLAWMVPPAMAKGPAPGVRRSAIVSDDGSRLYVTGYRSIVEQETDKIREATQPLGIQVIDTATWQVEQSFDLPVGRVHLSPDGSLLLGSGYTEEGAVTGGYWYTGSGVFAISTDTYAVTHFDADGYEWETEVSFSSDGSYAYLSDQFQIRVLDLARLDIVTETTGDAPDWIWGPAAVTYDWIGD